MEPENAITTCFLSWTQEKVAQHDVFYYVLVNILLCNVGPVAAIRSKPELKDLMDALYNQVEDKWMILGVQLGISHGSLKSIEANRQRDPQNCLLEVLEMWLQQVDPPPTWAAIIDAVEFIGKKQLGKDLRHKYHD